MKKIQFRRRDFFQNAAIVLLFLLAVALFTQTQLYSLEAGAGYLDSLLEGDASQNTSAPSEILAGFAAPVRTAVTGVYARLLEEGRGPTPQERATLERAFSRSGFTDAYWRGTKGPEMLGFRPENAPAAEEPLPPAEDLWSPRKPLASPFPLLCRPGDRSAQRRSRVAQGGALVWRYEARPVPVKKALWL